jgi:hypothetical protein
MMNSLPAGFYFPVFVSEDTSKTLFFLSADHEYSIKKAFAHFDELKKQSSVYKVSSFMTSADIKFRTEASSEIRALKITPREEDHLISQDSYDQWLEDKVILRTERFFPGRPVWNIASTRHALLRDYQFKGIGFTGISGRCDFPHIHGNLDVYLALYETVMSWHFDQTPIKSQKVVALWKDGHKTKPKILMMREGNSFRVAQIIGIDLDKSELEIIFRSLGVSNQNDLQNKLFAVIKNYAWFVAHSYEYTSPTFDNLMLDGSLIDCSSILHYNGQGWSIPFHLMKNLNGLWDVNYTLYVGVDTIMTYTHRAFKTLGLELDLESAIDYFWNELALLVGKNSQEVRSFFQKNKKWKEQSLEDWSTFLQNSFPDASIAYQHPEQSKFDTEPVEENKITFIISFAEGPQVNFSPYQVTDRIFQFLNSNRDIDPIQFAKAVIRSVQ